MSSFNFADANPGYHLRLIFFFQTDSVTLTVMFYRAYRGITNAKDIQLSPLLSFKKAILPFCLSSQNMNIKAKGSSNSFSWLAK